MAESTLVLTITDLQARLGAYAGWGQGNVSPYGDAAWTTYQQNIITDATASGLRRFYYPEPLPNQPQSHAWSFLRPNVTLPLVHNTQEIQLPDDFGGFEGELTIQTGAGVLWAPVKLCNIGEVEAKRMVWPTTSGKPQMIAVLWRKGSTSVSGQRATLQVWPLADTDYPVRFQYYILPDYLDATKAPYALGGAAHIETVLESCLAVMEERLYDVPRGQGVHGPAFIARLAASISMDRRSKAQDLGPNRDRSDDWGWDRGWNHVQNPIQYQGVVY
jgi:hypothetical protein